jgi:hypothetical protein
MKTPDTVTMHCPQCQTTYRMDRMERDMLVGPTRYAQCIPCLEASSRAFEARQAQLIARMGA